MMTDKIYISVLSSGFVRINFAKIIHNEYDSNLYEHGYAHFSDECIFE